MIKITRKAEPHACPAGYTGHWWPPMLWHGSLSSAEGIALRRRRAKPRIFYGAHFYRAHIPDSICQFPSVCAQTDSGAAFGTANICKANVIGLMLFTFVLLACEGSSHLSYFSTKMILAFFAANIILLEAERISIRIFLRSLRTNSYNQKHVLLIGYSRAEGFIDRVSVNPEWGYYVRNLDDHRPAGFAYKKVQVLGPTNHLSDFWRPIRWTKPLPDIKEV